jgi:hypothetical protein
MNRHADFAEPDLPPSRLPTLGYLAGLVALGILFALTVAVSCSRRW